MSTLQTLETSVGRFTIDAFEDGFFLHIPNATPHDMHDLGSKLPDSQADIEFRVLGALVESSKARESSRYMQAPFIGSAALTANLDD